MRETFPPSSTSKTGCTTPECGKGFYTPDAQYKRELSQNPMLLCIQAFTKCRFAK